MTSSTQDTPHINPPNPKKRKICERRSWVWDYFNYIEGATQFTCIRCSSVVQIFGSSTTELIRHLKESHQITQQSSLDLVLASTPDINFIDEESEDEIENNNEDSILSEKKRIKINNAVMRFIAQNNLPFIIVESDSFKYLLSLLNSKYKLPCRENFRNKILPKMVCKYLYKFYNNLRVLFIYLILKFIS